MTALLAFHFARSTFGLTRSSSLGRRIAPIVLTCAAAFVGSCSSSLDPSVDDKTCSSSGECLPGYVCSKEWICVHESHASDSVRSRDAALDDDADTASGGGDERKADAGQHDASTDIGRAAAAPGGDAGMCKDGMACGDQCVDLMNDAEHCGVCSQRCEPTPNGRAVCIDGTCKTACDQDYTQCDGKCYQLATDMQHCGDCHFSCPELEHGIMSCVDRACTPACIPGYESCNGQCVRFAIDANNCGGCGIACAADQICNEGKCGRVCPAPMLTCDQSCVDPKIEVQHCGMCGNACPVPAGGTAACANGECVQQCPEGLTPCDGTCVDTQSELAHCGACGNTCTSTASHSHPTCYYGQCGTGCDLPYVPCDAYCVNIALLRDQRAFALCAILAASQDNENP